MEVPPFLSLCSLMLLLFTAVSSPHNNFTDLSALLAFKAHVTDPYGILSTNWTTNTSVCNWIGVSCSHRRQRVAAVKLYGISLGGSIAPHLGNLSFLSYLSLGNNTLSGPIPDSLGRLRRLRYLNLQFNQLSGPIPTVIFNMSSLAHLSLAFNNLSGPLPLANHSNIIMLPQLKRITVSSNQISGEIPSSFAHCLSLQLLSLSGNQFSGVIPVELGKLPKLNFLYLGGNNLTGPIPSSLGNLTELNKLDLIDNKLIGSVPVTLGSNMPFLTFFNLERNQLSGGLDFITSFSNCRALERLIVSDNQLDGILPDSIGNLSTLFFYAATNHFKGEIPAVLGNLSSLVLLDLSSNELTGMIPPELTRLQKLQELYLGNNRIQGSIPRDLCQLRSLGKLILDVNLLSGSVPDSVGNLSMLEVLSLSSNAFSSDIPRTIWNLSALLYLDLSHNAFTGLLHSKVGNLKVLDGMDLSANQLSGSIPSAFGDLQMLEYLNLSHNSFQGFIPRSFGELINIQLLDLSSNTLSGAIPESLASLRYLNTLNLSFNILEGQIPKGGVFANVTIQSLMGNVALCGVQHLGFPPCSTNVYVSNSRKVVHKLRYILPVIVFILFLFACFCVLLIFRQRKRRRTNTLASNDPSHLKDHRMISYYELVRATDNFSEANLLGRGNFSSVFKGQLDDGLLTAIKVLNLEREGVSQSFDTECRALSMVQHRNLVKIISTCSNFDFKALVLQFMPNGSLERWLYSHNYCLSLLQRINIMVDVALALEYLHHYNPQVVVHCDLKPSNVLLDEEMTAHIGDFGIAKLLSGDSSKSAVSATTPGTIGYIPPEYGSTGKVSRRGDVYSYGILLLETFTRKKPTDAMFDGESSLRQWVSEAHTTTVLDIVDFSLLGDDGSGKPAEEKPMEDPYARHQCLSSIMELGLLCSRELPKERILMKDAVPRLQKIKIEYLSKFPNAN